MPWFSLKSPREEPLRLSFGSNNGEKGSKAGYGGIAGYYVGRSVKEKRSWYNEED